MSSVESPTPADALDILSREIERVKEERRPTSRHHLAELVAQRTGMPFRDALDVVEAFCERNAPAVPEYLMTEFAIFWLKVVAVLNAAVGVGMFYYSTVLYHSGSPMWPMLCLGTVFCGIAAFFWVKSLESEADRKRLGPADSKG